MQFEASYALAELVSVNDVFLTFSGQRCTGNVLIGSAH